MKPLKIIHLSGGGNYIPSKGVCKNSDIYFIDSWAGLIARRLKQFKSDLNIEFWGSEGDILKKIEREESILIRRII